MKLEVKDLRKSFGDKEVLHGISFSIESGRALGLLGRNGAGKTTTIRILMDVFRANSGTITVDGKPFHPRDFRIGYLPEERGLYPKKGVQEQLIYLAQLRGSSRSDAKRQSERWLKRLGVEEYAQRKLETLSKGNQQKVQLAQTLVCDPDLVILDEPFSGLDPVNSQILKDVIREQIEAGKLVIFSSHQMSYVEEFCEDIVLINHGESGSDQTRVRTQQTCDQPGRRVSGARADDQGLYGRPAACCREAEGSGDRRDERGMYPGASSERIPGAEPGSRGIWKL